MLNAPGSTFPSPAIEDAAVAAPQADWGGMGLSEHFVQFYDADGALVDAVAGFIAAALRAGDVGIVIATAAHRRGIEERLSAKGLDLAEARDRGRYVALDATETLASFLVDEIPDPAGFMEVVGGIVARAAEGGRRVWAFGEMVSLLALEGNHAAALRLEELWNDLQAHHSFALFCAYPMASLAGPALTEAFGEVCAQHARVIPAENYTALPTPDDRFRAIVRWQQKAESLETALAAELAARQEAEAALRLRDEFLLIASHELKTPLTTLSGHAQMALRQLEREGHLEPKRAVRSLETIREQAGKLSRLIAQLLDVSRLETGRLVLERTPTDLTGLVEQVVFAARVLSERHTITVTAPKSLEAWGDPLRLEQALAHLLENAVKYGPEGGQIDVVLARDGSETVQIAVRDRGPGIPMRMRARLFERFHQAHPNDHQGGMGLGLYISRQIVELHGGSIRAEFPPDGGTRFVVSLPIQ